MLAERLLGEAWALLESKVNTKDSGHVNAITTTNLYHLRVRFTQEVSEQFGDIHGEIAKKAIEEGVKCYAAKLHLNRGTSIENPDRKPNLGYAPTFEQLTKFPGRVKLMAQQKDLYGEERQGEPWLNGLPRTIFVSDMGDAFSDIEDFDFLEQEISETQTEVGRRHLWLWLTKRPDTMAKFAQQIGGFADNICAMTTVTSDKTLSRIEALKKVDCPIRGLSIEPLWTPIADRLDLDGIDWVIVGGEADAKKKAAKFPIEWALDVHQACKAARRCLLLQTAGPQSID